MIILAHTVKELANVRNHTKKVVFARGNQYIHICVLGCGFVFLVQIQSVNQFLFPTVFPGMVQFPVI